MTKPVKSATYLHGTAAHRRTQHDYMGALLDAVTLDDWREVVTGALTAAKAGDAASRAWLAQYLVGKPALEAPQPMTVIVNQLRGNDPLVERLAAPTVSRLTYGDLSADTRELQAEIEAEVAAELAQKVPQTGS